MAGEVAISTRDTTRERSDRILGCPDCDLVLEANDVDAHHIASCPRCGAVLYKGRGHRLDRAIALQVTALILFVVANAFPFITFRMEGLEQLSHLATGIWEFYERGLWPLALLVALVTIAFPLASRSWAVSTCCCRCA